MKDYGVTPQAWGPFSEAQKDIFNHRTLAKVAGRHGKTTAQVILRWHLQRNIPTIPKTVHRGRMAENLDVFDFELTEDEMNQMYALDTGKGSHDPEAPGVAEMLLQNYKIHD